MSDTPKLCRYFDHLISENERYYTFFTVHDGEEKPEPETYACEQHHREHQVETYLNGRVLITGLITDAVLEQDRRNRGVGTHTHSPWFDDFLADLEKVNEATKLWQREVWFGGCEPDKDPNRVEPYDKFMPDTLAYKRNKKGIVPGVVPEGSLQAFVIPAEYKGYRADVDGLTYLSYSMCGRSIFQIDAGDGSSVGIILDETSPSATGGVRNIHATSKRAVALIQRSIEDWKRGKINLVHSNGVGFGF